MPNQAPVGVNVSRETLEKLEHYAAEALRWNPAINLISKASVADLWQRHIWDSAQIFPLAEGGPGSWLDVGSGGGFPGIVMAIIGAQNVILVESDLRKATFLRQVSRQLDLRVTVHAKRLEDIAPQNATTMTARALASLTELLGHAKTHLAPTGRAIFPKGRSLQAEIDQAAKDWDFDFEKISSKTEAEAAILVVQNIKRR